MIDKMSKVVTYDLSARDANVLFKYGWRGLLFGFMIWSCGALTMMGLPGFARASDAETVKGQVATLARKMDEWQALDRVNGLERELYDVEQEIFSIESKLAEATALGRTADDLYNRRLSSLKSKKGAIERELQAARNHPALRHDGSS